MQLRRNPALLLILCLLDGKTEGFHFTRTKRATAFAVRVVHNGLRSSTSSSSSSDLDLKSELTAYLEKRKEANADEEAIKEIGKVIGGTKGNAILNYVSGAPNKETVIEEAPNVFDYDELTKYGFGYLVTPIMEAGGRLAMYELMGMPIPPPSRRLVVDEAPAPELVLDRTGENDPARYSGLKLGQLLDDDAMARALDAAQRRAKEGQRLRRKLVEEEYEMPFADKRNVGPRQTPDWTPEQLDEVGKARGRALAWARRAQEGAFVTDPYELMVVEGGLQLYSIIAALTVALGLGKSTPRLLEMLEMDPGALNVLQYPALALVLAHVASSLACGFWLAGERQRNPLVWTLKGFLAGPLAVSQLRGLKELLTRQQTDKSKAQ